MPEPVRGEEEGGAEDLRALRSVWDYLWQRCGALLLAAALTYFLLGR